MHFQLSDCFCLFQKKTSHKLFSFYLMLLSVWIVQAAHGQEVNDSSISDVNQLSAYQESGTISLDGLLDEEDWANAEIVSNFTQFEPIVGEPATQQTEVKVIYGKESLYVGALLYDENPKNIEAAMGRRDEFNRADWFLVSIDSYFDKKTAYTFGVNAAGVQLDAIQTSGRRSGGSDAGPGGDLSWDAIWYSSQRITHKGWIVEMRIPYSMLRFPARAEQTWGVHFTRSIPRLGEQSEWPHIPPVERTNLVARFGHLTGLNNVQPKRNIQISPYTLTQLQRNEDPEELGQVIGKGNMEVGADLKIGIGSNVTFDATINPDFGQVEADPSVLNLTAFEVRFRERRPFFLEGTQIFDFDAGPAQMIYTRRIGAREPIIGAAKISGQTEEGFSFGVLGAATGDDFNPERLFGVARITQQIGAYSRTGAMLTAVDSPSNFGLGQQRSLFAGIDYDLRFGDNMYNVEGFIGTTSRWQTSDGKSLDRGYGAKVLVRKRRGSLNGFFGIEGFNRLFNISDIGQLRQRNYFTFPLRLSYDINQGRPFGPFLRASIGDFSTQEFSLSDGTNLGQRHRLSAQGTLRSFELVGVGVSFENMFGGYDIFETRGLGPWARPYETSFSAEYATDSRRNWQVGPELSLSLVDNGGRTYGFGVTGNWNVSPQLVFSGNVDGRWEEDFIAWASNEAFMLSDNGWLIASESGVSAPDEYEPFEDQGQLDEAFPDATVGDTFYESAFGARDTRSVDFTLRSTVTFTPKLSVQVYSQLFLARGRYEDFQLLKNRDELTAIGSFPKRNEFAFSTLNSNVVLRWEYRPGSTLFVVWTHARRTNDVLNPLAPWGRSPYGRNLNGQISDTFDVIPTNVFLIKLSYTFL